MFQNTIEKIKQRLTESTKTIPEKEQRSSKSHCKKIPDVDTIVLDHTIKDRIMHTDMLSRGVDPRFDNRSYFERFQAVDKCMVLNVIPNYTMIGISPEQSNESRIALKYKTKKKDIDIHDNSFQHVSNVPATPIIDHSNYSISSTMALQKPINNPMLPTMVPPPQPYLDQAQHFTQYLPTVPPLQPMSNIGYQNSNIYDPLAAIDSGDPTYGYGNSLHANSIQSSARISSVDPRLKTRSQTTVYETTTVVEQIYNNAYPTNIHPNPPMPSASMNMMQPAYNKAAIYGSDTNPEREKYESDYNKSKIRGRDYERRGKDRDYRDRRGNEYDNKKGKRSDEPRFDKDYDGSSKSDRSYERKPRDSYNFATTKKYDNDNITNREHLQSREKSTYTSNNENRNNSGSLNNFKIPKVKRYDDRESAYKSSSKQKPALQNDVEFWEEDITTASKIEEQKANEIPYQKDKSKIQNYEELWEEDDITPSLNIHEQKHKNIDAPHQKHKPKNQNDEELWEEDDINPKTTTSEIPQQKTSEIPQRKTSEKIEKSSKTKHHTNQQENEPEFKKPKSKGAKMRKTDTLKAEPHKTQKAAKDLQNQDSSKLGGEDLLAQLSKMVDKDKLEKIKSILNESASSSSQCYKKEEGKVTSSKTNKSPKKNINKRIFVDSTDEEEKEELESKRTVKKSKKEKESPKCVEALKETELQKKEEEPPKKTNTQKKVSPQKPAHSQSKKKKTELDKLNEDIDNMFIRDGVLHATGRRPITYTSHNTQKESANEEEYYGVKVKKCHVLLAHVNVEKVLDQLASGLLKLLSSSVQAKIKNIDIQNHFQHTKSTQCQLCGFIGKYIVEHYMQEHPTSEVFISRVNPDVAKEIQSNPNFKGGTVCNPKLLNHSKITDKCKFCLQEFALKRRGWKLHIMEHTGEFKCKSCKVSSANPKDTKTFFDKYPHKKSCEKKKFSSDETQFNAGCLDAYMCQACNFVQLQKSNVEKHIEAQHDDINIEILRFDIVGFVVPNEEGPMMPKLERQVRDAELNNICIKTEHDYGGTPIKTEPDDIISNISDLLMVSHSEKKPSSEGSSEKNKYSSALNQKNQLKVWSSETCAKTKTSVNQMLSTDCLFSFYKCMYPICTFYTNNEAEMEKHSELHNTMNFECSYCDIKSNTVTGLIKHLNDIHKSSIYQCSYCFYRSCAAYNVVIHQNHYHRDLPNKVYICPGRPALLVNELDAIYASRLKYVPALICTSKHIFL